MSGAEEREEHQVAPRDQTDWVTATALPSYGSRSPDDWEPLGPYTIPAGLTEQIAPRRPGRATVLVNNTGANPAFICRRKTGSVPKTYVTLAAGGALAIDAEAPVLAYSALGTTVEVVETRWSVPELRANTEHMLFGLHQGAQ